MRRISSDIYGAQRFKFYPLKLESHKHLPFLINLGYKW